MRLEKSFVTVGLSHHQVLSLSISTIKSNWNVIICISLPWGEILYYLRDRIIISLQNICQIFTLRSHKNWKQDYLKKNWVLCHVFQMYCFKGTVVYSKTTENKRHGIRHDFLEIHLLWLLTSHENRIEYKKKIFSMNDFSSLLCFIADLICIV